MLARLCHAGAYPAGAAGGAPAGGGGIGGAGHELGAAEGHGRVTQGGFLYLLPATGPQSGHHCEPPGHPQLC
ncbi:MAG: hypothetical protein EA349_02670 [Halomonadaceae bacterium]|nr:MAG: hypothetical protein EA349_02670 [Halomonadaceae bacterium]